MSFDDLQAENKELRLQLSATQRLLEEQALASREQRSHLEGALVERADQARVLHTILNAIADGLVVCDRDGRLTHFNAAAERLLGMGKTETPPDQWSAVYRIFRTDMVTPYPADELPLARAAHGEAVDNVEMFIGHGKGSAGVWIEASARPIREADGAFCGGVVVFRDVSERKRWERDMEEQVAREREKAEALERLRSAVMELSTPILEVWDDVLALPVIGVLDTKRSAEMMERLLQAVEEKQCRFVIIDITGVEVVDSATADRLLKLVTAVEIVGARCILTGARGAVAQTLVSLGADLGSLLTLRNLKHGLRECLLSMEEDGRRAPLKASRARGPRA